MTRYLEQLNECTDPVTGDFLPIYDASAGSTDKDRKVNISRFAVLANAQTFTALQVFAPATTGANAIQANMPASTTGNALDAQYNSASRIAFQVQAALSRIFLSAFDNTTAEGSYIFLSRNNNASTPAAGFIGMNTRGAAAMYVWPDNTGVLRVSNGTTPTNANDLTGTVIGTQTSSRDSKNVLGEFTDYDGALEAILNAPLFDFTYKSGAFRGQQFTGIITDESPVFGMDRDDEHPFGKSLNPITSHGYEMAAIKALYCRLVALEKRTR